MTYNGIPPGLVFNDVTGYRPNDHVGCNVTTCPNRKCQATGECIDAATARQHVEISNRHVPSPPLAPDLKYVYPFDDKATMDARRLELAPKMRKRVIDADSATRKTYPMFSGLMAYFPDALAAVSHVSYQGNEKHNPGQPMHHARGKSMDHADCIARHLVNHGGFDGDMRESAALAWRALALLQEELEREFNLPLPRGARA